VIHLPPGVRVVRYGVLTLKEMGGPGFIISDDRTLRPSGIPQPRPERAFPVSPHADANAEVLVRIRVTGSVRRDMSSYRVRYRLGSVTYRQDLARDVELRLGPALA
jgi:hypothetical protein